MACGGLRVCATVPARAVAAPEEEQDDDDDDHDGCDHTEHLDPARCACQGGVRVRRLDHRVRIPASQEWAIELLASSDALLAGRDVPAAVAREAAQALSVPRSPLVMRRLSALRKELRAGDTTQIAAALGVLDVVADEGLRPPERDDTQPPALTPERIRLICYQVVHVPGRARLICCTLGTVTWLFLGHRGSVPQQQPPTVTQVYALAAALCAQLDEPYPETRADASALIQRLERSAVDSKQRPS